MLIAGMNTMNKLNDAVEFAKSAESHWPKSMHMPDGQFVMTYDFGEKAPDNEVLGPVTPRGGHAGIVYQGGKKLVEWGDVDNADMTFSVAKSYLALLAGLALGDGLIKSLDDKAGDYALDDGFKSDQNKDITWRHLLTQTSEWSGSVFGKEDRIDHNRVVGVTVADAPKGTRRAMKKPGTLLRIQRRAREPAQLLAAAGFQGAAAVGPEAPHHGSDRRLAAAGSGTAIKPPPSPSTASRCSPCPAAAIGAAAS